MSAAKPIARFNRFLMGSAALNPFYKQHNAKRPLVGGLSRSLLLSVDGLEVHPAAARHRRGGRAALLRHLGDHRLGGDQKGRH